MRDFKNKAFLITGASSGLGKALSFKIAEEGGNLLLGARRKEILEEIKSEIEKKYKVKVIWDFLDVKDEKSVKNFVRIATQSFDSIDCVINNAGIGLYSKFEDTELSDFERIFDINVKGVFLLTKEVVPYMRKQGGGIIVNISSLAGYISTPLMSVYAATKFALRGLTDGLRRELKGSKIKVIGVYPGPFESEFFKNAIKKVESLNFKRGKVFFSSLDFVAEKIIKGIKKGKDNIFIRWDLKLLAKLHEIITPLYDFLLSSDKYYENFEE